MRSLDRVNEPPGRPTQRVRAQTYEAFAPDDKSPSSVFRHIGRVIIGWLTLIIIVQLAVNYFSAN